MGDGLLQAQMQRKPTAQYWVVWTSLIVGAITQTIASDHDVCSEDDSCSPSFSIDRISQQKFPDGSMVHIMFTGRNLEAFAQSASDFVTTKSVDAIWDPILALYMRQPQVRLGVLANNNLADTVMTLPWEVLMRVGVYEDEFVLAHMPSGATSLSLVVLDARDEMWQVFDLVEFWAGPREEGKCSEEHSVGIPVSGGCYPPFFQPHQPKAEIVVIGLLASPRRWEGERRLASLWVIGAWVKERKCEGAKVTVWLDGELVGEEE
eukprot:252066-Rhodomonas_salina.1